MAVANQPVQGNAGEEEADKLRKIFGLETLEIQHIGSTSVPGLTAKPIIDIMLVVRDIHRVGDHNAAEQYPYDIESYIKGKEQLALEIDRQAAAWRRGNLQSRR